MSSTTNSVALDLCPHNMDAVVAWIKLSLGDHHSVQKAVGSFTKDQIEDQPFDILMMAVNYKLSALIETLLKKGLRSGFALDAAVYQCNLPLVKQLLDAGCSPSPEAERIAIRMCEPVIAQAIVTKRIENSWYNGSVDF